MSENKNLVPLATKVSIETKEWIEKQAEISEITVSEMVRRIVECSIGKMVGEDGEGELTDVVLTNVVKKKKSGGSWYDPYY